MRGQFIVWEKENVRFFIESVNEHANDWKNNNDQTVDIDLIIDINLGIFISNRRSWNIFNNCFVDL